MKILIRHMGNTFNYGSMMMGVNLIAYFRDHLDGDIEFAIDSTEKIHPQRMENATGLEKIKQDEYVILPKVNNKIVRKIYSFLEIVRYSYYCRKYDVICVIGGDDLSEYYGKINFIKSALISFLSARVTLVFLVGQTIGPFTGLTEIFAKNFLKKMNIYTRDSNSTEYLKKKLKINNVFESRDLAFLKLPGQGGNNLDILKKFKLNGKRYITIVPSGLSSHYTSDYGAYVGSWVEIINELFVSDKYEKIVLLAHVVGSVHYSDQNVIIDILKNLSGDVKLKIVSVIDILYPLEARTILGNGRFTLSGRMHASLSTFEMCKPAISLSYSIKYDGVIGLGLNMKELIIESSNAELWDNGKIVSLVMDKIKFVEEHYDAIIGKIQIGVADCECKAKKQLDDIIDKIKVNQWKKQQ